MTSPDTASTEASFGSEAETVDYIVVGSGAGGGPLAANLALAGYTVALLEAGGDESPPEYQVPAFYTRAVEHPDMSWEYFVRHYADDQRQRLDSKYCAKNDGVFYPRSGTLGGCTAHHAMITVYTHASDWDRIAELLRDPGWSAQAMEEYFRRLEHCRYIPPLGKRRTRHGFHGWLPTDIANPLLALRDWKIVRIALAALCGAVQGRFWASLGRLWRAYWSSPSGPIGFLKGYFDPNDRPHSAGSEEGLFYVPVSVDRGRRAGTRERILQTAADCPDRLLIRTHALVTRVLFQGRCAAGVEYLSGKHLYAADPKARTAAADRGERRTMRARREVILAAGSFNSPQLLKLSGIGPRQELGKLGIEVLADRPGVGENLQDRYEIAVITKLKSDFAITRGATFRAPCPGEPPDRLYAQWLEGKGPYTTNGGILAHVKQSRQAVGGTDLIAFAVPGLFRGYFPTFSTTIAQERNYYSWVILKAHVRNTAGRVLLRSRDPTERPDINFRYFDEGSGDWKADLEAVAEAVQYFRSLSARTRSINVEEVLPGPNVRTDSEVQDYVMRECWGHHASCSNKMGLAEDPMAVVDGAFRVHGVEGLRVVDASVFPIIPGFFIVTAVYMISEKASDLIIADAKRS
jgi:choline dehydrogenase